MPALAPALIAEAPDVLNAVRFNRDEHAVLECDGKKFSESNVFFADPSAFDVFSFPLIEGNKETVLKEPFSMVLTQRAAKKYFGEHDPMGQSMIYNGEYPLKIAGIIKNIPANTPLTCDFLVSFSSGREIHGSWKRRNEGDDGHWRGQRFPCVFF
jgi:putative ABC transport system permease protein